MTERSGLVCEMQNCSAYIYDQCDHCRKSLCIICIDEHHCSSGPCSSNAAIINQRIGSMNNFAAPSPVPVAPPQNRAAFERKKKLASTELLANNANKHPKYSIGAIIKDINDYPLTVMPASINRSWIWNHFKKINFKHGTGEIKIWANSHAACNICSDKALTDSKVKWDVSYTAAHSPGHLERHMKYFHKGILIDRRNSLAKEEMEGKSIISYYKKHPEFEELYLKWAVHTYQPLNTIEGERFRAMCKSLSADAPILTKVSVMKRLLQVESNVKYLFKKFLDGQQLAITLDHWTSMANVNYVGTTAHFITDQWVLKSYTLACTVHKGGSGGSLTQKVSNESLLVLINKIISSTLLRATSPRYTRKSFKSTIYPWTQLRRS